MFRAFLLAAPLIILPIAASAPPAAAAATAATSAAQAPSGERCQRRNEGRRRGMGVLGAIGRGIAGRVAGGAAANVLLPMGSMLGGAIMNLLNCDEQQKAATATEEVVERAERGGVGTTTSWESESRRGVRGTSTVTAVERRAPDGDCMTVTDVVIVDGEETRAPKRMCRRPPTNRYVRV